MNIESTSTDPDLSLADTPFMNAAIASGSGQRKILLPILLLFTAILVPIIQLVVGVPMAGPNRAHDGPFAISALVQFQHEMLAGHFPPRWASLGYGSLGSPIFFYYPPGAYFAAALLGLALPWLSAASIIAIAQILLRAGAMLACFAWLRRHTTTEAALTGSAFYTLMPCITISNPQIRLDFAECAATMLVPLLFLAVDAGRGRIVASILFVAAALAALTLVHLPTMVAASGLVVVYAFALAGSWRGGARAVLITSAGLLLGLGLAGCYLIPALGLLREISTSALWDANHQPEGHFILGLNTFHRSSLLINAGLLVPAGLAVLICVGVRFVQTYQHPVGGSRSDRALWAAFIVAVFMTMPISAPVWRFLSPLRMVQFPGRFLMPVSLLAAALIANFLPLCRPLLKRLVMLAGFGLGVAGIGLAVWFGDGMSDSRMRTHQALADPLANAPEYVPAAAARRGWLSLVLHGGDTHRRATRLIPPCVKPSRLPAGQEPGAPLEFGTGGCVGHTVLPQFFFPGWTARANGHALPVARDAASGLVVTDVPSGAKEVALSRSPLSIEWIGLLVSALSTVVWLGLLILMRTAWLGRGRGASAGPV